MSLKRKSNATKKDDIGIVSQNRSRIFIRDEKFIWLTADVVRQVGDDQCEVEITDDEYKAANPKACIRTVTKETDNSIGFYLQNENTDTIGVYDMCMLNYLHEPSILDNLRRRFKNLYPYTYTGEICIAVSNSSSFIAFIRLLIFKYIMLYNVDQSLPVAASLHKRNQVSDSR